MSIYECVRVSIYECVRESESLCWLLTANHPCIPLILLSLGIHALDKHEHMRYPTRIDCNYSTCWSCF